MSAQARVAQMLQLQFNGSRFDTTSASSLINFKSALTRVEATRSVREHNRFSQSCRGEKV